jgi:CubicO group peptidase (beta-lactamase class C family)
MKSRRDLLAWGLAAAVRRVARAASNTATVDATLRSGIVTRRIPNAAGMVANGTRTLYEGAFGTRDTSGAAVKVDSIFAIASMTKAVTTVAAMQLVESGKLHLDGPVSKFLPKLANPKVLTGFDESGLPVIQPAKNQITLKHLLTHTSGLCYDIWDGDMFRLSRNKALPDVTTTLMFEPGTRWQYGTGLDWAGRLVEEVSGMSLEEYFQTRILKPLGMNDTSYILPASKFDRMVSSWKRGENGTLEQDKRTPPALPKEFNGGGGLFSTAPDYVRFMQMILGKGRGVSGAVILRAGTVESMEMNQISVLSAGKMKSYRPLLSSDVDIQPEHTEKWGLGFLINTDPYDGGRAAGSLAWAGIFNTYFWIDVKRSLCAVLMMQFLPFVDREAIGLLGDFERAVYSSLEID